MDQGACKLWHNTIHQCKSAAMLSIINPIKGRPCDTDSIFLHTLALILIKNTQSNEAHNSLDLCVYTQIMTRTKSVHFLRSDDAQIHSH